MIKIARAIKASFLTSKARDKAAKGQFDFAEEYLKRAFSTVDIEFISQKAPLEMNLLASQIEIGLKNGPQALDAAKIARRQIEYMKENINNPNRLYLTLYCDALIDYCLIWRDGKSPTPNNQRQISLSGVSNHLIRKYPLPASGNFA